jgi:hypothetical protein
MSCYCRGAGTCEDCGGHTCNGFCTCELDGAPQTQEAVTAGYVNPSVAREAAWAEKQGLTR